MFSASLRVAEKFSVISRIIEWANNSDNSDVDEALELTADSATQALQTQLPRQIKNQAPEGPDGADEAMALADKALPRTVATATPKPAQHVPVDVKRVVRAARKRTHPAPTFGQAEWTARNGTVREEDFEDALQNIDAWLARLSTPEGAQCNERQLSFLQLVAQRVDT